MDRSVVFPILFVIIATTGIVLLKREERNQTYRVNAQVIALDSIKQIRLLDDSLVKPFLYTNISGFEKLPQHEAKLKFISAVLPAILIARHDIETSRIKIKKLFNKKEWNKSDSLFFIDMKNKLNAGTPKEVEAKLVSLPNSIVLAQAAVETGWGQSRFFVEARNIFGIWSYDENESRVVAGRTRSKKRIYVRSYLDLSGSVEDYFQTLGRSPAYRSLRKACRQTNDPFQLVSHLKFYSERRSAYTRQLKAIIVQNNLTQYDHYRIHPSYLKAE